MAILTTAFVAISGFVSLQIAQAQCAAPGENGRWHNLDPRGDPYLIDVAMLGCGDEVANGQQSPSSRYTMRAWAKQSPGLLYGRPTVNASFKPWKGQQWLVARIPTGGYLDNMWVNVVQRNGRCQLHVLIEHQSLDSKPNASSEYWFAH